MANEVVEVNPVRPGLMTTEFWVTLGASLVSVGMLTGLFQPGDVSAINDSVSQIAGSIGIVLVQLNYVWSRSSLKKEAAVQDVKMKIAQLKG